MLVLGVNSDLAWLLADGSGEVYISQGLSRVVHSTLPDKAPPVLCFLCVHTTQSTSAFVLPLSFEGSKIISIILEGI